QFLCGAANEDFSSARALGLSSVLYNFNATTSAITLYIDNTAPIGHGSMPVAYPENLKTNLDNGNQSCTTLLCEFKNIIAENTNPLLTCMIKHKADAFDVKTSTYPVKYISWRLFCEVPAASK
ncbi:alphaK I25, partial [Puccinia sorghi]